MLTRVVRTITRWAEVPSEDMSVSGMVVLRACEDISGWYVPSRDEPLVSMIVPADVAGHLRLSVKLHRFEREAETLLSWVPAVAFTEMQRNRLAFHGEVDERDAYEILLRNISVFEVCLSMALLVDQP